ncbi:MAG: dephospho-CoA kinase [Actinobacteria bacterium]|nr:dephospho-CoA kinase [Actinomycetota bacterium]
MLRLGLTGGIGSGKSTVAQRFQELGALVIDADLLAREVVAAGSQGLAMIVERFGDAVVAADGSLDRAALGEIVFADAWARKDLEAITHPLIGARTRSVLESAAPGQIVVHDVTLLAELHMAAAYHLTVVVGADEEVRMARLTGGRGLTEADARARIEAQASDGARRAAADAWLDNNGTVDALLAQVDALWQNRIVGFNDNLLTGSRSRGPDTPTLVPYDESWPLTASRLSGRITLALKAAGLGEAGVDVAHIGSTSVPGLPAKDVIDIQVGVRRLSDADRPEFVKALADKGFPRVDGSDNSNHQDTVHAWAPDAASWAKRFHGSADPGRVTHVHVREQESAGWEASLLFRDWLIANPSERDEYADLKRALARTEATTTAYTLAKEPWVDGALERARVWARHTGWSAQ